MINKELAEAIDPLTPDEERDAFREMIHAALHGDEDRRRAIRERIFRANIRLAKAIAEKIARRRRHAYGEYTSNVLDLMHVGYTAIYRSIDRFNVDAGNRFSTYVFSAIQNKMNMTDGIRKRKEIGVGPMKRLDEKINSDDETAWIELLEDKRCVPIPDMVSHRDKFEKLLKLIRKLPPRERDLVTARLGLDGGKHKLRDIAREYDISAARASQIVNAEIDKLCAYFTK
jgi:RNA polymerase sigma factor (sigma-70 family)